MNQFLIPVERLPGQWLASQGNTTRILGVQVVLSCHSLVA